MIQGVSIVHLFRTSESGKYKYKILEVYLCKNKIGKIYFFSICSVGFKYDFAVFLNVRDKGLCEYQS